MNRRMQHESQMRRVKPRVDSVSSGVIERNFGFAMVLLSSVGDGFHVDFFLFYVCGGGDLGY